MKTLHRTLWHAASVLSLLLCAGNAAATGYPIGTPTPVGTGLSCRDFDTANLLRELEITPQPVGISTHTDGTLAVTTIVYDTTSGWILDWYQDSSGHSIHSVLLDGSANGFLYSYSPPVTSDRGLHAGTVSVIAEIGTANVRYEPPARTSFCYSLPNTGFEGCTLGYWKVPRHHDAWPTQYRTNSNLQTYFGDAAFFDTFFNALNYKGGSGVDGGKRILLKQAVAALLDAGSDDLDYPLTEAEVIAMTRAALASGDRDTMLSLATTLDAYNNLGCPLN